MKLYQRLTGPNQNYLFSASSIAKYDRLSKRAARRKIKRLLKLGVIGVYRG